MGRAFFWIFGLALGLLPAGEASSQETPSGALQVTGAQYFDDKPVELPAEGGKVELTVTAGPDSDAILTLRAGISSLNGNEVSPSVWWRADIGQLPERVGAALLVGMGETVRLVLEVPPLPAGEYRTEVGLQASDRVFHVGFNVAPLPAPAELPTTLLQAGTLRAVVSPFSRKTEQFDLEAINDTTETVVFGKLETGNLTSKNVVVMSAPMVPHEIVAGSGNCESILPGTSCSFTITLPPGLRAGEYRFPVTATGLHGGVSITEIVLQVARPWWLAALLVTLGVVVGAAHVAYRSYVIPNNRLRAKLRQIMEGAASLAKSDADLPTPISGAAEALRAEALAAETEVIQGEDRVSLATELAMDLAVLSAAAKRRNFALPEPLASRLAPLVTALDVSIATSPRNRQSIEAALGQLETSANLLGSLDSAAKALRRAVGNWAKGLALPDLQLPDYATTALEAARAASSAAAGPLTVENSASLQLTAIQAAMTTLSAAEPGFGGAVREAGRALLESTPSGKKLPEEQIAELVEAAKALTTASEASSWAEQVMALTNAEVQESVHEQLEMVQESAPEIAAVLASYLQPTLGTSAEVLLARAKMGELIGVGVIAVLTGVAGHQAVIGENLIWGTPMDLFVAFVAGFITQSTVAQVVKPY
jgi:hypothetical protein